MGKRSTSKNKGRRKLGPRGLRLAISTKTERRSPKSAEEEEDDGSPNEGKLVALGGEQREVEGKEADGEEDDVETIMDRETGNAEERALTTFHTEHIGAMIKERLVPEPLLLVRPASQPGVVSCRHYGVGPARGQIMAKTVDRLPGVDELNLGNNRLNSPVITAMMKALSSGASPCLIKRLDLSGNAFASPAECKGEETTSAGSQALTAFLASKHCHIEELILRQTGLRDSDGAAIFTAITAGASGAGTDEGGGGGAGEGGGSGGGSRLRLLDLSRNSLKGTSAFSIAQYQFLTTCGSSLEEYSVAWNSLGGYPMLISLSLGLKQASKLASLNIAYNALGTRAVRVPGQPSGGPSAASHTQEEIDGGFVKLANALASSSSLRHLQMESNRFDDEACAIFAKAMSHNHSIFGLHFRENNEAHWHVNARGFIVRVPLGGFLDEPEEPTKSGVSAHQASHHVLSRAVGESSKAQCWICGGWTAQSVEYVPSGGKRSPRGSVLELTSVVSNTLAAMKMGKLWRKKTHRKEGQPSTAAQQGSKNKPNSSGAKQNNTAKPGQQQQDKDEEDSLTFYIHMSIDGYKAEKLDHKTVDGVPFVERMLPPGPVDWFFTLDGKAPLHVASALRNAPSGLEMIKRDFPSDFDDERTFTKPRHRHHEPDEEDSEPEPDWTLETSIFAPRKREAQCRAFFEPDKFIDKCFEMDWGMSRCAKLVEKAASKMKLSDSGLIGVKALLRSNYRPVIDIFRHYCVQGKVSMELW
eukprot:g3594.t1